MILLPYEAITAHTIISHSLAHIIKIDNVPENNKERGGYTKIDADYCLADM